MPSSTLPPSPRSPSLLQTVRFLKNPFPLLHECFEKLGPMFRLRLLGLGEWVFVGSPELVKELFKADPTVVASGEINSRQLGFLLGTDATFSKDGEDHMARRRLVHPYLNGKRAKDQVPLIRETALRAMERFSVDAFPFQPWAHHLSLEILARALFGASDEKDIQDLVKKFDRFAGRGLRSILVMIPKLQINLGPKSPWGKILGWRREVFDAVRALVRERMANRETFGDRDIASALVNTELEDGDHLSENSLVEELINDLFAGHETTGNILAWCVECIVSRPEVLGRLREELGGELGDRPIEATDLRRLPYLDAVINESIRFRPLAPMAGVRLTKQEFTLGGYVLPPETIVVHCFPVMAQRADLYESPDQFNPDHFLGKRPGAYEWNPFGGGRRMCLGRGLAEVELAVILAELLRRFEIEIVQSEVHSIRDGVFFAPSHGLRIRLQRSFAEAPASQ